MPDTTIAIVGGTGNLGSGLARLWLHAGYRVVLGSRSKERAESVAAALSGPGHCVSADDNLGASRSAGIVILAVPFAAHDALIEEIKPAVTGKIIVDTTVPLVPPKVSIVQLPACGSPAVVTQRMLGPDTRVVAAFHNVGAAKLQDGCKADCDVLVFGDDAEARAEVIKLAADVATRGIDGGVLANAVAAEALTSVLIAINRRYKIPGAGIRITGLPPVEAR
jgi:NADPH-dependent F420 reductase